MNRQSLSDEREAVEGVSILRLSHQAAREGPTGSGTRDESQTEFLTT